MQILEIHFSNAAARTGRSRWVTGSEAPRFNLYPIFVFIGGFTLDISNLHVDIGRIEIARRFNAEEAR